MFHQTTDYHPLVTNNNNNNNNKITYSANISMFVYYYASVGGAPEAYGSCCRMCVVYMCVCVCVCVCVCACVCVGVCVYLSRDFFAMVKN